MFRRGVFSKSQRSGEVDVQSWQRNPAHLVWEQATAAARCLLPLASSLLAGTHGFNDAFDHTLGITVTSKISGWPRYGLPAGCQGIMIISTPFSSYAQMDDPQASQESEEFKILTGHEAGHALSDRGHYDGDTAGLDPEPQGVQGNNFPNQNLMRSGNGWYVGPSSIFGNLRIWDHQVQWFRDGALEMGGKYLEAE